MLIVLDLAVGMSIDRVGSAVGAIMVVDEQSRPLLRKASDVCGSRVRRRKEEDAVATAVSLACRRGKHRSIAKA